MTAPVIDLELVPVDNRPGHFAAVLPDGRALVRASRQPLLDGARALAALGYSAETIITARHAGSDIVGMRSPVGEAVRWTVEERDRGGLRKVLWKPYEKADSSDGGASPAAEDVEAGQLAPGLPPVLSEAA